MKTTLFILSIFLLSLGCGQTINKPDRNWKTIEVGDYLFDFPSNFKLVKEKGIDSYVGKIQGDSMSFGFDFGYYSNDFEQTPQEYLDNGNWRLDLPLRFMKEGITYDRNNTPKVEVLNIRPANKADSMIGKGCDYVAECKHEEKRFDFPVYIPEEFKQQNFLIDTVDNLFRKIVYSKNPESGITGIYIRELNGFNESINSYLALSMSTSNLTNTKQLIAMKIFKTARHKGKQK